jgi:hypothetical protein
MFMEKHIFEAFLMKVRRCLALMLEITFFPGFILKMETHVLPKLLTVYMV